MTSCFYLEADGSTGVSRNLDLFSPLPMAGADAGVGPKSFCSERRSGPIQVTYGYERPGTLE